MSIQFAHLPLILLICALCACALLYDAAYLMPKVPLAIPIGYLLHCFGIPLGCLWHLLLFGPLSMRVPSFLCVLLFLYLYCLWQSLLVLLHCLNILLECLWHLHLYAAWLVSSAPSCMLPLAISQDSCVLFRCPWHLNMCTLNAFGISFSACPVGHLLLRIRGFPLPYSSFEQTLGCCPILFASMAVVITWFHFVSHDIVVPFA